MVNKDLYDGGFVEAMDQALDRLDGVGSVDPACFVYNCDGSQVGRVVCSSAALRWRAGFVSRLRFDCVLESGRLSSVFVCVASLRAAAFRCRAFVAGRGVLRCSAFLSDGRWVCSSVA